jgi:ribonuclease P protein component
MHKTERLTKTKDFTSVRRCGRSWSNRSLVLIVRPNNRNVSRFGFSVSKRVGIAVERNRIKRRLRAIAGFTQVQSGWDLVLIARKYANSSNYTNLRNSMTSLLKISGVLQDALPAVRSSTE